MLKTTTARLLALCTVTALASGCVAVPDNGYYDAPAYSTGYPQAYPSSPVYAPGVIYGPSVYPVAQPIYDGRRIDRERWQRERERDAQRERDRAQRERAAQRDRDRAQRDYQRDRDARHNAQRNEQARQQREREEARHRQQEQKQWQRRPKEFTTSEQVKEHFQRQQDGQ